MLDAPSCSVLELEDGTLVPLISEPSSGCDLDAREIRGEDGLPRMRIDVVTLFPGWFDWFTRAAPRANALALGHELDFVDLRASTPLKAGRWTTRPTGAGPAW